MRMRERMTMGRKRGGGRRSKMRGIWAVGEIAGCVSELRQTHVLRPLDRHKKNNERSSKTKNLNVDPPHWRWRCGR
eukprot:6110818-Pyramimonas_sp.AAC.1